MITPCLVHQPSLFPQRHVGLQRSVPVQNPQLAAARLRRAQRPPQRALNVEAGGVQRHNEVDGLTVQTSEVPGEMGISHGLTIGDRVPR